MQAIQEIPGVGDLTASALVAAVGDFCTFKSARQFASWWGWSRVTWGPAARRSSWASPSAATPPYELCKSLAPGL